MTVTRTAWCLRCPKCDTWASTLPITVNTAGHDQLDEDQRETGLAALRAENNLTIVERLLAHGAKSDGLVLDVGSAHGWFMRAAAEAGLQARGIEPDEAVASRAIMDAGAVQVGYFPDVLQPSDEFDVIAFNDVLEHLPDARGALVDSRCHLRPGGLLSLNLPNSRGVVFRIAAGLSRFGVHSPFERLWQVGLPSPHLWFFDPVGLATICREAGLEVVFTGHLKSATRSGLWQRAHSDRRLSTLSAIGVVAVWLTAPLLNSRRFSDITHLIVRRPATA